jgi:photosystem II stability/assembly factor-like uncharacterized protein
MVAAGYSPMYDFISATTGWALLVGSSLPTRFYVYRTTDGAKHWNMQLSAYSANLADLAIGEIKFFDSKRGVIWIGSPIQLYRTNDAGTHWDPVPLPPYQVNLVTFSDPLHIWLFASEPDPGLPPHFFATTDGGSAWTELAWPKGATRAIEIGNLQFRRPGEGWLAAEGESEPTVYSTVDGGASWEPHALPGPSGPDFVATFVGLLPGVGVFAYIDDFMPGRGPISFAYTSFDGGTTWRSVTTPPNTPVSNVVFQDSSHWWATLAGTMWESSDGGQTWKSVYHNVDNWLYRPQFIDAKHAWAELIPYGAGSGLAMTSDGGLHWTQVDAPQPP